MIIMVKSLVFCEKIYEYGDVQVMMSGSSMAIFDQYTMLTCPCDVYPLTPHIYTVKLGFTGVFIFFSSYFCS